MPLQTPNPHYVSIPLEIAANRPAAETRKRVGKYCGHRRIAAGTLRNHFRERWGIRCRSVASQRRCYRDSRRKKAMHGCPAGSVAGVASEPQAEHREDGGIVLADGFRQPICYGVEIAEYPVVSGQSAGSAEGIGLDKQLPK